MALLNMVQKLPLRSSAWLSLTWYKRLQLDHQYGSPEYGTKVYSWIISMALLNMVQKFTIRSSARLS
jgi:hypothetical protein